MIAELGKGTKKLLLTGNLFTLAAALLTALALFSFLSALVEGLIAPLIAAIFSKPVVHSLTFKIGETQFEYGDVLSALILLALALVVVSWGGRIRQASGDRSSDA